MHSLTAFVSTTALVLCTASGAFAQKTPDFSGTWTLDPASIPAAPAGGGLNPPRQLTLTQNAVTLAISWTLDGTTTTMTYNLDGSESRNQDGVSKATWQNNRLVIATPRNLGGSEIVLRRVLSLDGGHLVIEMEQPDPQGGKATVVRFIFKKG